MEDEYHIPEEFLVEIMCRLPRKSLCRFKCVSKQWCHLISDCSLVIPKTTKAGLVFHCIHHTSPESSLCHCLQTFLRLDNKGGASVDHSFDYILKSNRIFLDSCDDFLLLCEMVTKVKYFVYNPTTKWLEPLVPPNRLYSFTAGLSFAGSHFKVVFFSPSSNSSCFLFDVYSSRDKTWKQKVLASPFWHSLEFRAVSFCKPLFFKGAMHWQFLDHLLIYHLQDEFYKVIKIPFVKISDLNDAQCSYIWPFEGCLHYCQVCGDKIIIWILHMEEQNYIPGPQCFRWQQKQAGVLVPPNQLHFFTLLILLLSMKTLKSCIYGAMEVLFPTILKPENWRQHTYVRGKPKAIVPFPMWATPFHTWVAETCFNNVPNFSFSELTKI